MFQYAYVFPLITVMVVGELVIKPKNGIAIAGVETATFTCSVDKPAKLSWKFQTAAGAGELFLDYSAMSSIHPRYKAKIAYPNGHLEVHPNINGHLEVDLVIDEVDFSHAGTYTCFDSQHSYPHSAQLTVVKLHPLREYVTTNGSFVIGSLLEYAGPAVPRVDCFDAATNKYIDGFISNFTWMSENLTRIGADRTIKCAVTFCFNDSDCYARVLELLVIGLNSPESRYLHSDRSLYIVAACTVAVAAVASIILAIVFYFKSKYNPVTKSTFLGERLTMLDRKP